MRRRVLRARPMVVAAVLAVALGLAGGAVAFWSGTGSGGAQTRLDDPRPLLLDPGTASAQLVPGGNASVAVIASNPNPYTVHLSTLRLDTARGTGGFDVDAEHGGCALSALAFAPQSSGGTGWTVPPRAGGTDGRLPIDMAAAMTMDAGAANACQGATFTVYLVAGS